MADNPEHGDQAESSKEAAQRKFLSEVIGVLRHNRGALPHLPEMFEKLIEIPEAIVSDEKAADTAVDESRDEEHKLILARRQNEELNEKSKFLKEDNELKTKRIKTLEKTIADKNAEILAVKNSQGSKMSRDEKIFSLQKQLRQIEVEKAEKEKRILLLEQEAAERENGNNDLIRDNAEKEEKLKDQAEKISSLEEQLQELMEKRKVEKEEKFDKLKEVCKATVSKKDREIEQLKNRLASVSEKRVKQDQSKVEDTLSLNRQSKVEEDFANFIDEARMDVRDRIQTICQSQEKIDVDIYYPRLACLIFEATFERMKEARKAAFECIKEIARGLINTATQMSHYYSLNEKGGSPSFTVAHTVGVHRQELQYPADVVDALMLNLKETAPTCNLDYFVNDVIQGVLHKWYEWQSRDTYMKHLPNIYLLRDPAILTYINACIRLTWRMVTQIPPMQLEYKSLHFQNDIHRKIGYHNSPCMSACAESQGEEIACYLWPGLQDGGGRLIRAGEVLCKIKQS